MDHRASGEKNAYNYNSDNHLFVHISCTAPWRGARGFLLGAQSALFWLLRRHVTEQERKRLPTSPVSPSEESETEDSE